MWHWGLLENVHRTDTADLPSYPGSCEERGEREATVLQTSHRCAASVARLGLMADPIGIDFGGSGIKAAPVDLDPG